MNITLDQQLKRLRKTKNITQEALAAHLGLTVQAVSKWERGEGFPDITLLPFIASYFDVSVDELLGVGEIEKERKIEEYRDRNHKLFCEGKNSARVELMREAQKEFPNDFRVLYDLMYALGAEDRDANADEIIALGERILNESNENSLRSGAIQCLCFAYYYSKGDVETAKKYAGMADNLWCTVEELMPRLLEGDEAVRYCQSNLQAFCEMIWRNTRTMIFKGKYSPEDSLKAHEYMLGCFNLLYPDGNFGFYHCRISSIYKGMAKSYKDLGNTDEMFNCLALAAEHTVKYDTRCDGMYTAFMVNRIELRVNDAVKDYEENDSALLLKYLEGDMFKDFQNDERMTALKAKLKQVAVF